MEIVTQRLSRTKKFFKWALRISLIFILMMVFALASLWIWAKIEGPPPVKVPKPTSFYDTSGKIYGKWNYQNKNQAWVGLEHVAPKLREATVAIEDKRFYQHHGFDIRRILGAAIADTRSLSKAQGASTITMQYAKNLFLTNEKTWTRKLNEAFYTMRLEMNYSKNTILEGYLNTIYYGHGTYGIQAASKYYFNKKAADLTLAEASMLAGIPNGPSLYSPYLHFNQAKKRQQTVLNAMAASGYITKAQAKAAFHSKLNLVRHHPEEEKKAPYFQDAVKNELKNKLHLSDKMLATGGLKVYTTLNSNMQKAAEFWVKNTITAGSKIQTALVAMDPRTGGVEALIGGRDYERSAYNRALYAKRAPGSTFKPFLYYAALRNGFTPATELKSAPTTFTFDDGKARYAPNNFGGYYADQPITLAQALALSDNIYAVKTHLSIGMDQLVKTAAKAGITSPLSPIPSLALGSEPVSVLEMARGYATLANEGAKVEPHLITMVTDNKGNVLYNWHSQTKQVLNPQTTFVLSQLMTGIFDKRLDGYTKVTGSGVAGMLTHKMAAKTGSTATDSWMVGFTPNLVTSVWTGYDKGETISTYPDSGYAKDIWAHFMESALEGKPRNSFQPPKGVVAVKIDPKTGQLAAKQCPGRLTYFVKGTAPTTYCDGSQDNPDEKATKRHKKGFFERFFHWR